MDALAPKPPLRGIGYSIRANSPDFDDLGPKLDEAERLGVDFVELPIFAWTLVSGGRVLGDRLARLVKATRNRPFGYTVHGHLAINLMDAPSRLPRHEALLRAALAISGELGAVTMVMHAGCVRGDDDVELSYARQRDALSVAGDWAASAGLTLCVENIFRFEPMRETPLPSRLAMEIDAVGHPHVRATLDVSHAFLRCTDARADFMAEIAALAPFARHLHVHDSFGIPQESWVADGAESMALGEGDLHLPIGWGAIDWDRVASACAMDAGTVVNLELHRRYWSELSAQIEVLRGLEGKFLAAARERAVEAA